jgi:hypothetical protein
VGEGIQNILTGTRRLQTARRQFEHTARVQEYRGQSGNWPEVAVLPESRT